jgi:hypothetical protein
MVRAAVRRHLLAASFASLVGLAVAYCGQALLATTAATVMPACSNVDASLFAPLTGIDILADSLTAGRGCGTGKGQIYKYAAFVGIPPDNGAGFDAGTDVAGEPLEYLTWGIYDCFADGIFANLCTYGPDASTADTFFVKVYAFNADDWNSTFGVQELVPIPDAGPDADAALEGVDAGGGNEIITVQRSVSTDVTDFVTPPPVANPNGGTACVGSQLVAPEALPSRGLAHATWATTCTATQQANVSVLAQCAPLEPGFIEP